MVAADVYTSPQAISFNVYGGRGNAYSLFNEEVASTPSNNVWTRLVARNNSVVAFGLQELCAKQMFIIVQKLAAAGMSMASSWYAQIASTALNDKCGDQYGVLAGVIGASSGTPISQGFISQSGESYGFACVTSVYIWSCTAHTHPINATVRNRQINEYRSVVAYAQASSGKTAYGGGDLNQPVGDAVWYSAWGLTSGFSEADYRTTSSQSTLDSVGRLNHVFPKNPAPWTQGPHININHISDHHWYQGYL